MHRAEDEDGDPVAAGSILSTDGTNALEWTTPVGGEVASPDPDGFRTDFTTAGPYLPGSLQVFVDGVTIVGGLTETDPTSGTFTLDFAPLPAVGDSRAERVTASYLPA
jgi:hypothetical protein